MSSLSDLFNKIDLYPSIQEAKNCSSNVMIKSILPDGAVRKLTVASIHA